MNVWETIGPTLAKQVELITNLTNKNSQLLEENEELKRKYNISSLTQRDLYNEKEALKATCTKEHAGLVERNASLLTENQRLIGAVQQEQAKLQTMQTEMSAEIERLNQAIKESQALAYQQLDRAVEETQALADQRYVAVFRERNALAQERDKLLEQNQRLMENADTESEQEPVPSLRITRPRVARVPHPTGDQCRVPNCGVTSASNWRRNNYSNPDYGEKICEACHARERRRVERRERYLREKEKNKPAKANEKSHPEGGCCLICRAETSSMWRKNNTGNPEYGSVICNACWHTQRRK